MTIDHSVYPDIEPPDDLPTDEDKADYIQRLCGAWDFGVVPEIATVRALAGWKDVFDRFPIPHSPAYHAFRTWFGWEPVASVPYPSRPLWEALDAEEGRTDPCVDWV
jgi:hypothetical protein